VGNPRRPPGRLPKAAPPAMALLHLPSVLPAVTIHVPILMYHHVSSAPPATELNYGLTVTDQDFTAQLTYLRDHGYHTVTELQVFDALYRHKPLPAKPVMLTFDDGYLDNYTDALPILKRFHDHGEFNIISAYVGTTLGVNSYMTWPQLQKLVAAGMDIGSHTVDHQDLGTLSEDKIRFELRDSRNVLQLKLHVPVQWLAYPSGQPFASESAAAQQLLLTLLPEYGYVGALLDGPITTSLQSAQTPYQLARIRVAGGESLADYIASLSA
jgi:peptidoglycan/xylan/chitin deacetylase (PgdA/CDA1 family)